MLPVLTGEKQWGCAMKFVSMVVDDDLLKKIDGLDGKTRNEKVYKALTEYFDGKPYTDLKAEKLVEDFFAAELTKLKKAT